ncbi:MAG: lysophospholipid acyltransferase family protein, partial [bacterium]
VEGGVFVPFFGVPVPISTAAAGLALKLKVPIFMAFCVSDPNGVYHGYSREWMMPEDLQGVSAEEVTARIATVIEDAIRKDPGQWLWSYKRWKRRLPGVDPSRYPYYADC